MVAINKAGGKEGALAANTLPSENIAIYFHEKTKDWYTQNTDWVAKAFGNPNALAVKTYPVFAKGVPKAWI